MKVKLEEDHQRRFIKSLKAKPRKLPYKDAVSFWFMGLWYIILWGVETGVLYSFFLLLLIFSQRIWIQANLGADTKEEFFDMVANGNLKTPYIPKHPDEYYSDEGTWISWDHFLHGIFETKNNKKEDDTLDNP